MPLFQAKTGNVAAVLTKDGDRIVAYTLTPQGVKQLRSGLAHSPHLADAAGQSLLGFQADEKENFLPSCELTGATSDVHLVVYGEGSGTVAKLLGMEPRFVLQKATKLSVPVTVLSLAAIGQLETAPKLPPNSAAASTLREW